ncbi:MAG TPA: pantetheine-phosphate adenylyltransferase [Thermodesulfobacteriota bacterium]|nr:pantetheine-phosphate adenylyltransferase [Thermodesulfobacteriota bacterium]
MPRIAVYPGSFDPITNGHLDLIDRGVEIADRLVVAVARNVEKQTLFSVDERLALIRASLTGRRSAERVEVDAFDGLLVEYAAAKGATMILRGLRAVSDFEYEFQMALMNRQLAPKIETVFMMTSVKYSFLSSRLVKEVAGYGGPVADMVPPPVAEALRARFARPARGGA